MLRLDRAAHPQPPLSLRSSAYVRAPTAQYCPPGTGEEDTPLFKDDAASWTETPMVSSAQGERCCLKAHVPPLHKGGGHWTGLAPRAVADGKISKQCVGPPPPPPAPPVNPGCKTWDGKCVQPYPGEEWQHPKIHQSPDCLHLGGWHDMAGALTFDGTNGTVPALWRRVTRDKPVNCGLVADDVMRLRQTIGRALTARIVWVVRGRLYTR